MIDYTTEPLLSTPKKPEKLAKQAWFAVNTPTTYWVVGQKRSGKGVAIDQFITRWLRAGLFLFYMHSAGGFENLYLCVNKNCKARWKNAIAKGEISEEGRLHCNCSKAVAIVVMIPDFIKMNQESVDRFNGVYWSGLDEYTEAYISCKVDEPPIHLQDYTKVKKPHKLRPYPMIIFKSFKVPINTRTKDNITTFREQFLEMVLDARKTHRPLVFSPSFYPETHKGKD